MATQDLDTIMRRIVAAYPNDHLGANTITLDPMWRSPFGANGYMAATLPILLAIAGVVLLLTCANVATLTLVRFVSRRREMAIRQSLGANRVQLVRQMLLEGVILSLWRGSGGAAADLLDGEDICAVHSAELEPHCCLNGTVDQNVVIGIVVLALLASVLCGAFPAWRSSHVPAAEVLKDESASVSGGSRNRHLLSGLVVAQIATFAGAAGEFRAVSADAAESLRWRSRVRAGSCSDGVGGSEYRRLPQRRGGGDPPQDPGSGGGVAGRDGCVAHGLGADELYAEDGNAYPEGYVPRPHESLEVRRADVSPRYFETLGIPLIEGRDFTQNDNEKAPLVLIVDETAARRYWPGQDALGKKLACGVVPA